MKMKMTENVTFKAKSIVFKWSDYFKQDCINILNKTRRQHR